MRNKKTVFIWAMSYFERNIASTFCSRDSVMSPQLITHNKIPYTRVLNCILYSDHRREEEKKITRKTTTTRWPTQHNAQGKKINPNVLVVTIRYYLNSTLSRINMSLFVRLHPTRPNKVQQAVIFFFFFSFLRHVPLLCFDWFRFQFDESALWCGSRGILLWRQIIRENNNIIIN